jgi:hypothetical protein
LTTGEQPYFLIVASDFQGTNTWGHHLPRLQRKTEAQYFLNDLCAVEYSIFSALNEGRTTSLSATHVIGQLFNDSTPATPTQYYQREATRGGGPIAQNSDAAPIRKVGIGMKSGV